MADIGFVRGALKGIKDEATRRVLTDIFEHILGNLRFGAPEHQVRTENFQIYWENSTTAASTGEFSFPHGLGSAPKYAIPALELDRIGSRIVPLEVTRVADASRIYLKSTSTGAQVLLLIE